MDFKDFKDYITTGIAFVGIILGLYNLYKQHSHEKRSLIEPYYVRKWKEVSDSLRKHLRYVKDWISKLSQGRGERDFYPTLSIEAKTYEFDRTQCKYDRKFASIVRSYFAEVELLMGYVNSYNRLLDPITLNYQTGRFLYFGNKELDEEKKKVQEERFESARRIAFRYWVNSNANKVDTEALANSPTYRQDLAQIKFQIASVVGETVAN